MKKLDGYELNITQNDNVLQFTFMSEGKKGSIEKMIEFTPMQNSRWNLGFGDIQNEDWVDSVVSNNNNMRKVLQTVANTIHAFFDIYPKHEILIMPVDRRRKLLYNRTFQQKWAEIEPIFAVKAIDLNTIKPKVEDYSSEKIYDYFLITRKS